MRSEEDFDRRGHYDPNEPLLVPWADVIAARNAVVQLMLLVRDEPLSDSTRFVLRDGLPTGVLTVERELETDVETAEWLKDLRDRLNGYLPTPGQTPFTPLN